ncbi:MAG: gliding motility-associated C-terminal domain-containing protein [Burkholderiales bacterium]|nr:gliding motility-associated C-terminal domain-containing protein [Bacteroidia bacterium]
MFSFKKIALFIFVFFCTFKNNAQSVGGFAAGTATYCDTTNAGFVSISGQVGNVTTWQYSINGGVNWFNNGNPTTTQSYNNLNKSTCYRAIVQNGSFPPDTSTFVCITIYFPTVGGTILGGGTFCGGSGTGNLYLTGNTGSVLYWQSSLNGGSSWVNISNTSTTLSYSNITQNTLYRVIVQNSAFCLKDTSSLANFIINPLTVAGTITAVGTTTVCYALNSNTINLSGNVGNVLNWLSSTNNGVSWTTIFNTTTTLITSNLSQTSLFAALVQSANCSVDTTNKIKITVISPNIVNAGLDTTITQGQTVPLNGSGTGSPSWSPSSGLDNPGIFNPIASPAATTNYILSVTDINMCVNSDTMIITVMPLDFDGAITSVFSPNGDGINDNWYIENIKFYPGNEVTVFNIYGNVVFNKKGYNNDWPGTCNGAPLPDGTYFYVITFEGINSIKKGSLDILKNN